MSDMKSISIAKKVHIPLILSITLGFVIILANYFYSIAEMKSDVYAEKTETLSRIYDDAIGLKNSIGLTNAINISKNYSVVRALKEGNRELAIEGLERLSQEFKTYTSYNNVKVHIHDADRF